MKNIISACTFSAVDPDSLASFDLEYIFLKLRSKSVGEIAELSCKCSKCEAFTKTTLNLEEIKFDLDPKKDKIIMLTEKIGINMKYIQVRDMTVLMNENRDRGDMITDVVIASIASIFDENGVYPSEQTSREEMDTFINSLNRQQMNLIETFIAEAPKLTHKIKFVCKSCKEENIIELSGAQSFFE